MTVDCIKNADEGYAIGINELTILHIFDYAKDAHSARLSVERLSEIAQLPIEIVSVTARNDLFPEGAKP